MILKNYGKDYKSTISTNSKGKTVEKFVYVGDYFQLEPEQVWKKNRLIAAAGALFLAVLYGITGFTGGDSGRTFYVVFPYVLGFLPAAFLLAGAYGVLRFPRRMKREERDRSWLRLKQMGIFLLACSAATAAGQIVFLILAENRPFKEWLFLLLSLVIFSGCCIFTHWTRENCRKIVIIPANTCKQ